MARNPRFDVLFEPVRIGPVTAPNRFYQVPHASGMTNSLPQVRAAFRGVKAEGGWGVVCTGAVSIHPSSDDSPLPFAMLWDDKDIRAHALMTDAVHEHGALAGIELWHGGACTLNRTSRLAPLSPSGMPWLSTHLGFMGNLRPRTMDSPTSAICSLAGEPARTARHAGGLRHRLCLRRHGLPAVRVSAARIQPPDRCLRRLDRESCAFGARTARSHARCGGRSVRVALRISLEELRGKPGVNAASEAHEVVQLLGEIPDLWDVKMDSSPTDCAPSRFSAEGSHEPIVNFVKQLTKRPVVGVGRFTSPGRHGLADTTRHPRSDRRRAAVHRRPVPAERRSTRGASTRFANASAAISASRAGTTACRCAAHRTRRLARNGAADGTRSASTPPGGSDHRS